MGQGRWLNIDGQRRTALRRHHRLKNAPGWIHTYDPTHGTSSITTPLGATYTDKRETVLPPRSPDPDDRPDPNLDPPPF
ncbi:hypothetical protein BJF85_07785 [Saccharomonospora sp. CUA-673]|uniref:hypothetical protein n=1 Tax=Saccharomonospora sp. CUA-673 TaxID=1904969 RepID=UPI000965DF6B|nr:hypothetical protein [Saccharomonospora sp. CUA-673]OLT39096.1 hypothetical protein BJF85_07785 [Saccharomonospora sp. CUA-673]